MSNTTVHGGRLLVLSYHYVREAGGPFPGIHPISASALRLQLQELLGTLHGATPEEVEAFAAGRHRFARDAFLATFDDGLVDHRTAAVDVLEPLGLRGAFFVCTRPQSEQRAPSVFKVHWLRARMAPQDFDASLRRHVAPPWKDRQLTAQEVERAARTYIHDQPAAQGLKFKLNFLMPADVVDQATTRMLADHGMDEERFCKETFLDAAGLQALHRAGHVVGLHGHSHAAFSALHDAALRRDLGENARVLTELVGAAPKWLAYPYGRKEALPADPEALCARFGVRAAFTMLPGWNDGTQASAALRRITPNELPAWVQDPPAARAAERAATKEARA